MNLKSVSILLIFLSVGKISFAQSTGLAGFDLRLFRPPADGTGLLNLHRSETLAPWKFQTGLFLEEGHGLLAAVNPVSGQNIRVVDDLLTANLQGAVGLTKFLDVGINLPVVAMERGTNFTSLSRFTTAAFGDLGLELKLRILADKGIRPGIALLSNMTFPTGSESKFTGTGTVTGEARLIADKRFGPVSLVTNFGYRTLGRTQVVNLDIDDSLTYGGGLGVTLPIQGNSVELMAEVDGSTVLRSPRKLTSPIEWLVGVRKMTKSGLAFQLAGGGGITDGVGAGEWRVIGGIQFSPQKAGKKVRGGEPLLLETIYFPFDRDRYLPKYEPGIDGVSEKVRAGKKVQIIQIRGHTDSAGTDRYNLDLSRRRAERVQKALERRGIEKKRMMVEAVGSKEPAADNGTLKGRAGNRRVEILEVFK